MLRIIIFSICLLYPAQALAAEAALPVSVTLLSCGAASKPRTIIEACHKDARCCVFMDRVNDEHVAEYKLSRQSRSAPLLHTIADKKSVLE